MNELLEKLQNPYVGVYAIAFLLTVLLIPLCRRCQKYLQDKRRKDTGLPVHRLPGPGEGLSELRQRAKIDALALVVVIVVLPVILYGIAWCRESDKAQTALLVPFLGIIAWVLISSTTVASAFLGGLLFRVLMGFKPAFQLGDRVSLDGHVGTVVDIDPFYVRLATPDDDLVSIPTHTLWGKPLLSVNAGSRSSLCVMPFHLAPYATPDQRVTAEDIIWDTVQSSMYFEPSKPLQIYIAQSPDAIALTAKAYVASTYREPDFKSEVTSRVLTCLADADIPLANRAVRAEVLRLED